MYYTLPHIIRVGLDLARKTRPKHQQKPLGGRDGRGFFSLKTRTVWRGTYIQAQMNVDPLA